MSGATATEVCTEVMKTLSGPKKRKCQKRCADSPDFRAVVTPAVRVSWQVTFLGNPMMDGLEPTGSLDPLLHQIPSDYQLVLLPGSRPPEVLDHKDEVNFDFGCHILENAKSECEASFKFTSCFLPLASDNLFRLPSRSIPISSSCWPVVRKQRCG